MRNIVTNEPLKVEFDDWGPPSMELPADMLPAVESLFNAMEVRYSVKDQRISFQGGPYEAWITFSYRENPERLQALLDSVP